MPDLRLQFGIHAPNGARLATLPYPLAASVADVVNDLGTGTLDYLATVQHADKLEELCEVSAEIGVDGGQWREFGARWLRLKRGGSVIEETRTRRYVLHSFGFMLGKVRMLREETLNENGDRIMAGATPGGLIKTLLDEAKTRGNISGLVYTFTAAKDSAGADWVGALPPQTIRYGDDLLSLLRSLSDSGYLDWHIVGRELRILKPDTLGSPRAFQLHNGIDLTEAPDDEDATEMAGRVGVQGDDGRTYEHVSPSMGPWGLWEELVNAPGVKDIGGLQFIGEAEQSRRDAPRVQMTRGLRLAGVDYLPGIDYAIGDTITAPNDRGVQAPLRVRQITLGIAPGAVTGNLILGDRFLEKDVRTRRTLAGLLGGAAASAGGSGTPTPPGDDKRAPKAPTGLVVSSAHAFTPEGSPFALIDSAFVPVTQGADGTPLGIRSHEMYARENIVGEPWRKIAEVGGSEARITYSPLPAGEEWQFKLRAVSTQAVVGEFGDTVTVVLARDIDPPPRPSKPTATARLGVVTVTWDGLDESDTQMPVDFDRVFVWQAPGQIIGSAGRGVGERSFHVTGLPYNEPHEFWLTASDTSGNMSEASASVTVTTTPLVDTDVIGRVIDAANIELGAIDTELIADEAITAGKVKALAITADKLAANSVVADKIAANEVTADKLAANSVTADKIEAGAVTATKIAVNAITADKIAAGAITADKIVVGSGANQIPDAGFATPIGVAWQIAEGAAPWSIDNVGGAWQRAAKLVMSGQGRQVLRSQRMQVQAGDSLRLSIGMHWTNEGVANPYALVEFLDAEGVFVSDVPAWYAPGGWQIKTLDLVVPSGVAFARVALVGESGGVGTAFFGLPSLRSRTTGALIVDGSVTADKIAASAITADKINASAITADKLAANAITGKTITGGTINGAVLNAEDAVTLSPAGSIALQWVNSIGQTATTRIRGGGNSPTVSFDDGIDVSGSIKAGSQGISTTGRMSCAKGSTTSAANIRSSTSSGEFQFVSSMRKFKLDREPILPDYRLLDLPAMTWRDRAMVEENPGTERRVAGFVAEDLAALSAFSERAFEPLLEIGDDDRAAGIQYDRVVAYLLPIIRDLHERVTALESA
ncbi:hypothetical protein SK224_05575 [Microbacterium sp. BG28]|uniref:hypothetical protein n=1 Tax=Microbacterium sp. BG28 TaxID=3097356 RepID=UPI002A5AA72D|nr:hypothetical protein [Microbacterium sp. BG28]MDY0828594.1 hypothetical protein [Microbacterium sp. BG28]